MSHPGIASSFDRRGELTKLSPSGSRKLCTIRIWIDVILDGTARFVLLVKNSNLHWFKDLHWEFEGVFFRIIFIHNSIPLLNIWKQNWIADWLHRATNHWLQRLLATLCLNISKEIWFRLKFLLGVEFSLQYMLTSFWVIYWNKMVSLLLFWSVLSLWVYLLSC